MLLRGTMLEDEVEQTRTNIMSVVLENLQYAIKQLDTNNKKNSDISSKTVTSHSTRDRLDEIPKFFFAAQDLDDPLIQLVKKIAIERRIERVEALLLNSADLQLVWTLLNDHSRLVQVIDGKIISYQEFKRIADLVPHKIKWLFKPEVFLRLPKTEQGDISIQMLFSYVTRAGMYRLTHLTTILIARSNHYRFLAVNWVAALVEAQFTLTNYSREFEGFLTEEELQQYLEDMIPHLNLKPQSTNLRKFYICTYVG